ncbi:MAG: reverse transcriptase domain-containing protein [Litorimonas sp.]
MVPVRAFAEPKLAEGYLKHFANYKKLLRQIGGAQTPETAKSKIKTFFRRYDICYVALVHAAKKLNLIFSCTEIDALAKELAKSKDFSEPIRVTTQPKKSGGLRYICKSGHKRRAVQFLVHQVMIQLNIGYAHDTSMSGNGGRDKFVISVMAACEKRGLKYVVKFDISDCYGSIDHKATWDILEMFPKDVIAFHVLNHPRHYLYFNDIKYEDRKHATRMARRGIPQGSPSSSRLASAVVERLLEGVIATSTCEVYIHGDDGAICTSSLSEAMAIKNALVTRCKNHPFGPFRLKYCKDAYIPTGVGLMGYHIKTFPYYIPDTNVNLESKPNSRLIAAPSRESFKAFFKKLKTNLKTYSDEEFVNEAWEAGRKWLQAYKLWKCQPYIKLDGSIVDDYPTQGGYNFVTQIIQIIYDEDKRRGYTKTLSWVLDLNARCVLSRVGLPQTATIQLHETQQLLLIEHDAPPLRLCDHRTVKESFLRRTLQNLYFAARTLFSEIDKILIRSLKLN